MMQRCTRSSGRTQVRSAQVEEGRGGRVLEGYLRWFRFSLTRKEGDLGGGADFRGFVFNSSWILAPGVGQYLSHAVSTLFMREREHKWHLWHHKHALLVLENRILLTNRPLYLAHDLIVRNCSPALVVCNDLRLLINFLWEKIWA